MAHTGFAASLLVFRVRLLMFAGIDMFWALLRLILARAARCKHYYYYYHIGGH